MKKLIFIMLVSLMTFSTFGEAPMTSLSHAINGQVLIWNNRTKQGRFAQPEIGKYYSLSRTNFRYEALYVRKILDDKAFIVEVQFDNKVWPDKYAIVKTDKPCQFATNDKFEVWGKYKFTGIQEYTNSLSQVLHFRVFEQQQPVKHKN